MENSVENAQKPGNKHRKVEQLDRQMDRQTTLNIMPPLSSAGGVMIGYMRLI